MPISNLFEALEDELQDQLCFGFAAGQGVFALAENVENLIFPGGSGGGRSDAQVFGNAYNAFCNRPPTDVSGDLPVPFQGGQCDVLYDLFANVTATRDGVVVANNIMTGTGLGPVSVSEETTTLPNGTVRTDVTYSGPDSILGQYPSRIEEPLAGGGTRVTTSELSNFSLTRVDGLPDDCGNPTPDLPVYDPADFTGNPPVTYTDNDGNQVTINPEFTFGPVELGPGGGLSVPVSITFEPNVTVGADINLETGDINFNFGPTGDGGGATEPVELPPETPEEETRGRIVGVRVMCTIDQGDITATEIEKGPEEQNLFVPRLGTVRFSYRLGSGSLVQGKDLDVRAVDEVLYSETCAEDVVGTPGEGVTFQLSPIIVPVCVPRWE